MGNIGRQIGDGIRKARKAAGLTQIEAASLVGKTEATIVHWEQGKNNIKLSDLVSLLDVYEAVIARENGYRTTSSIDEMIGRSGKEETCTADSTTTVTS